MHQFKRHFSIEEAKALIPELRARFADIQLLVAQARAEQLAHAERLRILRGNGKGPVLQGASGHIAAIQAHIDAIVGAGVQIKDLERGLIDFPHYLNGDSAHEVFLCFETADKELAFWHEIEDGIAGRQPL